MQITEYESIRAEMLQKFKRLDELLIFSITAVAALLAWLATRENNVYYLTNFVFSIAGLAVTLCVFYVYRVILRQIYHQGSYLAVFHESNNIDLRYHLLTRFFDNLRERDDNEIQSNWGKDGRTAATILLLLIPVNLFAPWFLQNEVDFPSATLENLFIFGLFVRILILFVSLSIVETRNLWTTRKSMKEDMKQWFEIRARLKENPSLLKNTIGKELEIEEKDLPSLL